MSNLNKAWQRYLTLSWCLALSCLPFQQSDRGEGPRQHCGWQRCGEDESWTRSIKISSCLSCTYQLRNFWCHQSTFSVTTGQVWSVSLLTTSTIFQSNNFQGIIFVVTCVPDLDLDHLVVYFVSRVLMSTLMVEMKLLALESSRNLSRRNDLPTPESPTWNKHSCRQFLGSWSTIPWTPPTSRTPPHSCPPGPPCSPLKLILSLQHCSARAGVLCCSTWSGDPGWTLEWWDTGASLAHSSGTVCCF